MILSIQYYRRTVVTGDCVSVAGEYLWEHILDGEVEEKMGGVWSYGTKRIGAITFRLVTLVTWKCDCMCFSSSCIVMRSISSLVAVLCT